MLRNMASRGCDMSDQPSPEGIESLYRLYSDDVYRYAFYSLSNQHDANDVVQEVFSTYLVVNHCSELYERFLS